MKTCIICKESKEDIAFRKKRGEGYSPRCDSCRAKCVAATMRWHRKDPGRQKAYNQAYNHGLTVKEYKALVTKQNGLCAICKEEPLDRALAVDHCHETDKIRGLLCMNCNTGLGKFKDSISLLQQALSYLMTHKNPLAAQKSFI